MKCLCCIVFVSVVYSSLAQDYISLANTFYSNTLDNRFDNSEALTTVEEFALDFTLPLPISKKTFWITNNL